MLKKVAENIKKKRKEINLSQQDVADKMNCSRQYYSRIESGEHDYRLCTLHKVANALDTSIVELIS